LLHYGTIWGHKWAAVQWLQLTATSRAQADLNNILASIGGLWSSELGAVQPPQFVYLGNEGVWITPGPGEIIGTYGTPFTGSNGNSAIESASGCYVINEHVSAYYRGGHPRLYLPGVRQDQVTNGSDIGGSILGSLQTHFLNILNGINALTHGGITAVVLGTVSFQSGNAWRTPPIFRPHVGITVRSKLGTQRRRITS
jgi:hypothetical protein